jgi:hypothetical protein
MVIVETCSNLPKFNRRSGGAHAGQAVPTIGWDTAHPTEIHSS